MSTYFDRFEIVHILRKNIDMKLGLVTKPDKRNMGTPKKIDDNVMSADCDVIVFFLIYGQSEQSRSRILKT